MDFTQFTPATALVTVILLALAPFVAVMVTSFTKIVVVLGLLRNALGLQQSPPNIVLNGLALILSIYVMYPTVQKMSAAVATSQVSLSPKSATDMLAVANAAKEPLREFLLKHTPPRERAFFFKTAKKILPDPAKAELMNSDFVVIIPAFTVSELSKAFQIGFLIFLPFLIIDLVISNILMAMGMMMLSPTTVSLPFKLLLFVLIDGWVKLAHGLVLSYAGG
jgi:type III secretion protein R